MSLEVESAEGSRAVSEFIDVPWQIREISEHPRWVPQPRMMTRELLDTKRHPFYRAADRALFIARRDGKLVGRIAAIANHAHTAFHGDRLGFFGFFESENERETASALLDHAAGWLRGRGLERMRGPVHPSTNYDCGVLVDGFDEHPTFLTTWNPPYYDAILTASGLARAKDLVGYWLPLGAPGYELPARLTAMANRAAARSGIVFRDLEPRSYWSAVEKCWAVYNSAWESNWGFVPMSREEFLHMARSIRPLLEKRFAFMAEVRGETVGFMLGLPDYAHAFRHIRNGRLLPLGWLHLLRARFRERHGRVIALGISPAYRSGGILPLFLHEALRRAIAWGSPGAEASWILEDNHGMRSPLESVGGRAYRRWRLYERTI